MGMPTLALTDRYLLTGAVEFVQACKEEGIRPILGLEIDLGSGPLTLLAQDQTGWTNLCRLSSHLAGRLSPQASCPDEDLALYTGGLLALAPFGRIDPQSLPKLKDLFPRRLYLALTDPVIGLPASHLARQMGLPLVVARPAACLEPGQQELLVTLAAVRRNCKISELGPEDRPAAPLHFASPSEMLTAFAGFRPALQRTIEAAERCQFELPLGETRMPELSLPGGASASETLRSRAEAGAGKRYGHITAEIRSRLDHELAIIDQMGYAPVFLVAEEILAFARASGVPHSSRGSAASSLVAHCLGITSPDPLRLDLYFERFLNPARLKPPDIDTDLCSKRRDGVIQYVFERFGVDRVAMVATINHFRPRSALREVARAHGLPPSQIRDLIGRLPHAYWARAAEKDQDASPFRGLQQAFPDARLQRVLHEAEAILGLPRHLSVHPGGLVVSPLPIADLVGVMPSGSKGITITQMDLGSIEALGLVKIDLLGIRGLTVLGDVAEHIQRGQPEQYPEPLAVLDSTPAIDSPTASLVEHGQTIGCFQIESPGMRATLREIQACSQDDIMAALALYRPGPLSGGLKDAFVRRFKGEEAVVHIHPALALILAETHGVILYQEQVLRIANQLAGFSLAEADLLRRAMSHFDPGRRMQELRAKFVREAESRSGIPAATGEQVWEMMAAFAGYGFPKAHAASYAELAWRSAWAKTHFPAEFMAAVLANWGGYYSQRVYISEARRMDLVVRPPHVNHSRREFSVGQDEDGAALFMGLDQVRQLSRRTIGRILRLRPFGTLEDFLSRVDPRRQEAENLAKVGALAGLGRIPAILRRLQEAWLPGQPSLFASPVMVGADWDLDRKMAAQHELLGISVEAHPLELLADRIANLGAYSTIEAAERPGQRIQVAGVRQTSRRTRTAAGEAMLLLTLEDLSGMLEVVVFPKAYRQWRELLGSSAPLLITGRVEQDPGQEPCLVAEQVEVL